MSIAILSAYAVGKTWNLQGSTYTVDTLYHAKVGPGTTQTSLAVAGSLDLRIFYTTTDLSNPNVEMRVAKAGNMIQKMRSVSGLSKDNSVDGAQYFVGVNADFFDMSTGQPLGSNILNGEVYNMTSNSNWTEISFDASKMPNISNISISGSISKSDGSTYAVSGINTTRYTDYLVIFTHRYGSSTGTNEWGKEVVVTPIETGATIAIGKTVKMKVVGTPGTSADIPTGSYVLSGHGAAATFVSGMADGDIIEVTMNATTANGKTEDPIWAVGGCPVILKDGVVQETEDANIISHLPDKEPRTAVGYDATGTKVVMLVVDGRSSISDGCRTKILADIMREVGCSNAMNFDGGGSTELYHQKLGIRNVPSGGVERSVTNALFAVATTPTDNDIAEIQFVDWVKEVPKYGYYTPKFYGYNKYGVLVNTDLQGVKLSCLSELGEVVEDGKTLFGNGGGTHALTATYNGVTASIAVTVDDITEPLFRHSKVLLDSYKNYTMDVYGIVRGSDVSIDNSAFAWETGDANIATVDEAGVVKGVNNGTTIIKGSVGDFSKEIEVTVEIPTARYQDITSYDTSTWTVEVSNLENQSITSLPTGGFAVDYTTTASRKIYLTLAKDAKSWSRPDSLLVEINPGTSSWKTLTINATDYRTPDTPVTYEFSPNLVANEINRVLVPMSALVDVEDMSTYPLVFNNLYIVLADTKGSTHHFELSKMQWVYNAVPADASGVDNIIESKEELKLSPNPVNSGDMVRLNISESVDYIVYGVDGSVVAKGTGTEISTSGMSEGVYIVTVIQNGERQSTRLLVK